MTQALSKFLYFETLGEARSNYKGHRILEQGRILHQRYFPPCCKLTWIDVGDHPAGHVLAAVLLLGVAVAGAVAVAVAGAHAVGILTPVGRVGVVPGRRKTSKSMNVDTG